MVEVEVEKDENLLDIADATGYSGFATLSQAKTDYYYVDFSLAQAPNSQQPSGYEVEELFRSLPSYINNEKDYTFNKCSFTDSGLVEGFLLRAYFVENSKY